MKFLQDAHRSVDCLRCSSSRCSSFERSRSHSSVAEDELIRARSPACGHPAAKPPAPLRKTAWGISEGTPTGALPPRMLPSISPTAPTADSGDVPSTNHDHCASVAQLGRCRTAEVRSKVPEPVPPFAIHGNTAAPRSEAAFVMAATKGLPSSSRYTCPSELKTSACSAGVVPTVKSSPAPYPLASPARTAWNRAGKLPPRQSAKTCWIPGVPSVTTTIVLANRSASILAKSFTNSSVAISWQ
mmetsp:Transcript_21825/g.60950  ORF Transcript_21825/g.60950 Transcript_21825/m.60950 type:complete len:243 (+) Transcript_21825:320-1048(+)